MRGGGVDVRAFAEFFVLLSVGDDGPSASIGDPGRPSGVRAGGRKCDGGVGWGLGSRVTCVRESGLGVDPKFRDRSGGGRLGTAP